MKKEQYELDNGWIVWTDGLKYFLDIKPLENTLFRKERTVEISDEIFEVVKNGERKLSELFKKYNLHKYIIKWVKPVKASVSMKRVNTENKFYGKDYIATREGTSYYLEYRLARHGDGGRKIKVNKNIYEDARSSEKSISELFKKYNLYHLDTPDNDV